MGEETIIVRFKNTVFEGLGPRINANKPRNMEIRRH